MKPTINMIRTALAAAYPRKDWMTLTDLNMEDQEQWNAMEKGLASVFHWIQNEERRRIRTQLDTLRTNVIDGNLPVLSLNNTPSRAFLRGFDMALESVSDLG